MIYEEAVNYLETIPMFTKKTELENTKRLLSLLGEPQRGKKIIHVAGTNGKGSVCAMLAAVMEKSGKRTGLFTSPHLIAMEERIQINQKNVDRGVFTRAFEKVLDASRQMETEGFLHPAYFEFLFGMAMLVFEWEKTDWIVLETGLGGRLDATNIIEKPEVCVIMPVSFDHTELLGETIEKIALEKAGIIKEGVPVVYWGENMEVAQVIEQEAAKKHAPAYSISEKNYKILRITKKSIDFCAFCGYYENEVFSLPFAAPYQAVNGIMALMTIKLLDEKLCIPKHTVEEAYRTVRWQGRMEEVLPDVYVDGAHNEAGILAFADAVLACTEYKTKKKFLLFSAVKEKEFSKMAEILCDKIKFDGIIITEVKGARRVLAKTLEAEFNRVSDTPVYAYCEEDKAFNRAMELKGKDGVLFCAGSLYLVGALKALIEKEKNLYDRF